MDFVARLFHVLLVCWYCLLSRASGEGYPRVVFVLLSQPHPHHVGLAERMAESWRRQLADLEVQNSTSSLPMSPVLTISYPYRKVFSIVPVLAQLAANHTLNDADWFFIATEQTSINVTLLRRVLSRYDNCSDCQFLGHSIHDPSPTIIHHFLLAQSPHILKYPLVHSGFALKSSLLRTAAKYANNFNPVFNIDPIFELAVFLRYMTYPDLADMYPTPLAPHAEGVALTDISEFCTCEPNKTWTCASYCLKTTTLCQVREKLSNVFFAVKTCQKFHESRLPIVQQTWGATSHIRVRYFSDQADSRYHTIDGGVPNAQRGHCEKTMAIIAAYYRDRELRDTDWLVIADDDTIFSVQRLLQLLGCYNSTIPTLLGEVYGYSAASRNGYLFVTGGGGMILSRSAVSTLMSQAKPPKCPSPEFADDMFLGIQAQHHSIYMVHSQTFHQNQPDSYHQEVLSSHELVSCHRHSPMDPITVYNTHLKVVQDHKAAYTTGKPFSKSEL